jgi:hypothetical protein
MPPSSHYLNLLNLNQPGDDGQDAFVADDLSKELELFTNSNFLDQESGFFPGAQAHANYVAGQYGLQQQQQVKRSVQSLSPSINLAPAQTLDLNYMFNTPPAATTLPPAATELANDKKRSLAQTDFALSDVAQSPSTLDGTSNAGNNKHAKSLEEEDKRRRNTQASARFRVKKKQREQALQESARQMTDKCNALESRVKELELENKWLRNLLKPSDGKQATSVFGTGPESSQ